MLGLKFQAVLEFQSLIETKRSDAWVIDWMLKEKGDDEEEDTLSVPSDTPYNVHLHYTLTERSGHNLIC